MDEKENVVRLRGLPWSAISSDIVTFFQGCSIENDEDGIHILKLADGRSTGEAFVEFTSDDDVKKALLKSKNYIGRRYIDVFKVKRSEMKYVMKRMNQSTMDKTDLPIVRLRGLPFGCSKEEVANFFTGLQIAPNGIKFLTDHLGRCTGEGFVQFLSSDSIQKALAKHKQSIGHRYIEVFQSSAEELRSSLARSLGCNAMMFPPPFNMTNSLFNRFSPHQKRLGYTNQFPRNVLNGRRFEDFHNSDNYGHGYLRNPDYSSSLFIEGGLGRGKNFNQMIEFPPNMRFFNNHSTSRGGGAKRPFIGGYRYKPHESVTGHSIHMRGLPYTATEQDIIDFFSPLSLVDVKIQMNSSGRPSGDADVDFESHELAIEAMKKNRASMNKRYIELFLRPGSHTNFGTFINNKVSSKVQL